MTRPEAQIASTELLLFNFQGSDQILEKKEQTRKHGGVAQLGEHLPCKQGVMGSNPIISTSPAGRAKSNEVSEGCKCITRVASDSKSNGLKDIARDGMNYTSTMLAHSSAG